jgi:hydrogenase small subunit
MSLSRRQFLKLLSGSAVTFGIGSMFGPAWLKPVAEALAANKDGNLPVIWLQGQSCAGCSVSVLNTVYPDIAKVLTETISLEFQPNVMASAGDLAISILNDAVTKKKGKFVLAVEGSVPTDDKGLYSTMGEKSGHHITTKDWVEKLGNSAFAVLNVGTCAAFGGIPAGKGNTTGAKAVPEIIPDVTQINIPGCPAHPDWIVGTIAHVLLFGIPDLDDQKRPRMFFTHVIHEQCERRSYFEEGKMAEDFGQEGCLFELGCKGPIAHCDASIRSWNNKVNWCVRSGAPCMGCTEPTFPDHDGEGLYAKLPREKTHGLAWIKDGRPEDVKV